MPKVFISHATDDRYFVENELVHTLKGSGIDVWYSRDDILSAAQWEREIRKGLESCDYFLVLLSPHAVNSRWVRIEVNWAVEHRYDRIVPVLLRSCNPADLHIVLEQIQYVDYRQDQKEARLRLLQVWGKVTSRVPVIAVMGAKGGVGKTTITSCIAQMVAEMGHDVAIVDFDILDIGVSNEAKRYFPVRSFAVKTVYDHIAPHSSHCPACQESQDQKLCNITPRYLRERNLGSIWLLPARDRQRNKLPFQVLSSLPEPQPELLRRLTREILQRVRTEQPTVRLILIDCGAGRNTLFSAAFAEADLGYIITLPNKAYFENITEHHDELADLYPEIDQRKVFTVVNRVTCEPEVELCAHLYPEPIAFIPFDPTVEKDNNLLGSVEYGLGYNTVFSAVHKCLQNSLPTEYRHLLPDEFVVRHKPWFRVLVEEGLAERKLKSPAFRLRTLASWVLPAVLGLLFVTLFVVHLRTPMAPSVPEVGPSVAVAPEKGLSSTIGDERTSTGSSGSRPAGTVFTLIGLGCLFGIATGWLVLIQHPRYQLLKQVARLPRQMEREHRELLHKLLTEGDQSFSTARLLWPGLNRSLLRWLKGLVDDRLTTEKARKLQSAEE